MRCSHCGLPEDHRFGIALDRTSTCSGCSAFEHRRQNLFALDAMDPEHIYSQLASNLGEKFNQAIVPLHVDNESHFVIETLLNMGIRPTVCYYNPLYMDALAFDYISRIQEIFDVDVLGINLPYSTQKRLLSNSVVTHQNARKFEILGNFVASLYYAQSLGIHNIISGPQQSSEIVGNISHHFPALLRYPELQDRIICAPLSNYEQMILVNCNSRLSEFFTEEALKRLLNQHSWSFLSDYVHWDSEAINSQFSDKYGFEPRIERSYGACYQSVSSSLKLGEFELLNQVRGFTPKLRSYLARDIRFGRITLEEADEQLDIFQGKSWDVTGLADFMELEEQGVQDLVDIVAKRTGYGEVKFEKDPNRLPIVRHAQTLF